jgi:tetratricopeptide (TPR) repeat protein
MRRNLGQNLYLTAVALQARGDADAALKTFQEGVALDEALLAEDPGSLELRRNLAYLRTEFGSLHERRHNYRAALEQFRRALSLFETISHSDPKNADARLGVAIGHHNVGTIWWDTGDFETALKELTEARRFYEPVVAADPGNTWAAGMLARLYFFMGDVEQRLGKGLAAAARRERFERACACYALASEVYARLKAAGTLDAVQGENSEETAQALARCRGSRD